MPSLFGAIPYLAILCRTELSGLSRLLALFSFPYHHHLSLFSPSTFLVTRDISMTTPPLTSGQPEQEAEGKVQKLKRRFFELDEKYKEIRSKALLSGERNVRMREEQDSLNEKNQDLENGKLHPNGFPLVGSTSSVVSMAQSSPSILPCDLPNAQGRTSSVSNLHTLKAEDGAGDAQDPLLKERHLGHDGEARGHGDDKGEDVGKSDHGEGSYSVTGGSAVMSYSPQLQDGGRSAVAISNLDHRMNSPISTPSQGHPPSSSHSKSPSIQSHVEPRLSILDNDVDMNDATASDENQATSNNSHCLSAVRKTSQKGQDHDLGGAGSCVPGPSTHAKDVEAGPPRRSNRQSKGLSERVSRTTRTTRSGNSAIAAAKVETAAAIARRQASPGIINNHHAQQDVQMANCITTATNANLSPKNNNNNPSTKSADSINPTSSVSQTQTPSLESTPSMENIIKVAAAAVAAQNAAAASAAANAILSTPSQSRQVVDPNLDPSLFPNKAVVASKKPPAVDTNLTSSGSNSAANSATTKSTTTPTSSLSSNPYLSLSMFARQNPGSTTPNGHPMMPMHPPPMYYPLNPPPNASTYPIYSNPYYYLTGPMASGSNGMFSPPGAAFPPPPTQRQPPEPPRTVKSKRLKTHTVTTRSFSIPMVPRDKNGKPMLPLNVGIMTVINLGEVCMREHFHTERYIFPVGYEVTRRYLSTIDPGIEVVYHCTILDGGDGPKFQIIPSDRVDKPVIAGTATGAWSNIVRQANAIRNRQHSNSVSGPDFFGLGQNTIKHLIQELPNSDRLRDYVWQNFVEGGPLGGRHAAVIPALPEEYDASLPIGAYYPKREASADPGVPRGLSHYPQHIIAQAEAQKSQKLATQQARESGTGPSSSSQQDGSRLSQNARRDNHVQIALPPATSSDGLNIEHYQPKQQVRRQSQSPEKRATGDTNANANTSASSASGRRTRAATRGSQRQTQQQQQQPSASSPSTSMPSTSEVIPTTLVGIMSQFPVPGLVDNATSS